MEASLWYTNLKNNILSLLPYSLHWKRVSKPSPSQRRGLYKGINTRRQRYLGPSWWWFTTGIDQIIFVWNMFFSSFTFLLIWLHFQTGAPNSEKLAIYRFSSLLPKREFSFPKSSGKASGFTLTAPLWVICLSLIQSLFPYWPGLFISHPQIRDVRRDYPKKEKGGIWQGGKNRGSQHPRTQN